MPKFRVTRKYQSGRAGPWQAGEIVSLDDQELIDWLKRDGGPDLLKLIETLEPRTLDQPPADRMVRRGKKRSIK